MKKKLSAQYYVVYERDSKKGYIASAPALQGCVVYGKTLKEAHKNISVAIQECLEVIHQFKKEPPQETFKPDMARRFSFVDVKVPEYAKN